MKHIIKQIIVFIIILLAFIIIFTLRWLYGTFGNLSLDEIIFQIKVPMQGSNTDFYFNYAQNALIYILISTIIVYLALKIIFRQKRFNVKKMGRHSKSSTSLIVYKKFKVDKKYLGQLAIAIIIFGTSLSYANYKTEFAKYIENQNAESNLIEKEYVNAKNVNIKFPETKRNLIYIYLESMEATLFSKENGGAYEESIIPEIEQLALENTSFSSTDSLQGLYSLPGSTWTTGAMVAQSAGLPLKIPIEKNSYGEYDTFLPGAYSVGEILKDQGYNQMLLLGSDAAFGGRKNFFQQHGGYEIYDVNSAIADGRKTQDDLVWWGFIDVDVFNYAREKITELAEKDEPFNFTTLTTDTHFPEGFYCAECLNEHDEQYLNVMSCSSRRVNEFVNWVKEQDFYENTTIIICGDHPSMQQGTFDEFEENGYTRTVFNIIINPAVEIETKDTKNKECSTIDMFPTTIASLGATIDGDRLALGTNLFSNKKTLVKRYGLETVTEEFNKTSRFFNKQFIYNEN